VRTIHANVTTANLSSPKKQNKNTGAIAGGTIVGVAAIISVIGIVAFVQRRRRRRQYKRESILSGDSVDAGPQMIVSPWDPNSLDANRNPGISAERQPLVIGEPETAMVALHHLSSSPPPELPLLQQVAPIPVGLSDKEIARLRAETLSSPQPRNLVSALNVSQSTSHQNAVTESGESTLDTRRLRPEFEPLRREVGPLPEKRSAVGAPPSYAEGDR